MNWTKPKLRVLEKAYKQAVADDVALFTFEGHELVTAYAKYLIEYLKGILK